MQTSKHCCDFPHHVNVIDFAFYQWKSLPADPFCTVLQVTNRTGTKALPHVTNIHQHLATMCPYTKAKVLWHAAGDKPPPNILDDLHFD